jgi:hypothetical protein
MKNWLLHIWSQLWYVTSCFIGRFFLGKSTKRVLIMAIYECPNYSVLHDEV